MLEFRWVLLGLGALLVVGVYLWSRGVFKRRAHVELTHSRSEPTMDVEFTRPHSLDQPLPAQTNFESDVGADLDADSTPTQGPRNRTPNAPERVVALRLIPRDGQLSSEKAVLALRGAGLRHGRYGIFHRIAGVQGDDAAFSVASLTEPGSFDLANLAETTIAGLSLFVVLPGNGDPVERFDMMIEAARSLAVELDADLHDERGSSWSVQRERYVREEIIEYRHQLERR